MNNFFKTIWDRVKAEPAVVTMLINQLFLFAAAFGLSLSAEQMVQINALLAICLTVITRQNVTPVSKMTTSEVEIVANRPPKT